MADISRADVATLIEEAYSHVLLDAAAASSTVLSAFPTVNLGTKTTHLPVLATLPVAGWVSETDTKPTSEVTWKDLTMVVEELAVIVPIHEDVLADSTVSILEEVTTRAGEAIGKKLDQAVLFGTGKPASWVSPDLHTACHTASQYHAVTNGAANVNDIIGAANQAAKSLALAGFLPDALITSQALKYDVANVRDAQGHPIFTTDSLGGFTTTYNRNGAWDAAAATAFLVDSSRVRIGVRQDISVKYLTEATVATINLAERDMVALRFKARYAYVLGISTTSLGVDQTPVAAIVPSGGS